MSDAVEYYSYSETMIVMSREYDASDAQKKKKPGEQQWKIF